MAGFILSGASLAAPGPSTTPAVNTRSRLEGLPLSADLQPALSAEVADPLWLLCRQWQFLEFAGEDAGTPIDVRVEGEQAQLSRYLSGVARCRRRRPGSRLLRRGPRTRGGRRGRAGPRAPRPAGGRGGGPAAVDPQRRTAERPLRSGVPLPADRGGRRPTGPVPSGRPLPAARSIDARKLLAALQPLRNASGALTSPPPGARHPGGAAGPGPRAAQSLAPLVRDGARRPGDRRGVEPGPSGVRVRRLRAHVGRRGHPQR